MKIEWEEGGRGGGHGGCNVRVEEGLALEPDLRFEDQMKFDAEVAVEGVEVGSRGLRTQARVQNSSCLSPPVGNAGHPNVHWQPFSSVET